MGSFRKFIPGSRYKPYQNTNELTLLIQPEGLATHPLKILTLLIIEKCTWYFTHWPAVGLYYPSRPIKETYILGHIVLLKFPLRTRQLTHHDEWAQLFSGLYKGKLSHCTAWISSVTWHEKLIALLLYVIVPKNFRGSTKWLSFEDQSVFHW